jgi:putative tryptophan/tyrosine transport system substrate-binding protein
MMVLAMSILPRSCRAIALFLAFSISQSTAQTVPTMAWVANANANPDRLAIFKKELTVLGYGEGRNINIEYRTATLDDDYAPIMAGLVASKVDIIVATNAPAAVAARKATHAIPIVMAAVNDPVGLGLVKSLERPGTNVTGTTMYAPHLIGERLRTLQKVVPGLRRVAMLSNGNNASNQAQFAILYAEAQAVGIAVLQLDVRAPSDVEPAFRNAVKFGADGLLNAVDSFINSQRFAIATLAAQYRLPCVYTDREYVLAGGLMAIGPGHQEGFRGAADYVDKILRGASPAELPVALTKSVSFSVSHKALDQSGLRLPNDVRDRVNDWVD